MDKMDTDKYNKMRALIQAYQLYNKIVDSLERTKKNNQCFKILLQDMLINLSVYSSGESKQKLDRLILFVEEVIRRYNYGEDMDVSTNKSLYISCRNLSPETLEDTAQFFDLLNDNTLQQQSCGLK